MKRASELQAGDVIRIEYGDYGNWMKSTIESVEVKESKVEAKCKSGGVIYDFEFSPNEKVQVIENERTKIS